MDATETTRAPLPRGPRRCGFAPSQGADVLFYWPATAGRAVLVNVVTFVPGPGVNVIVPAPVGPVLVTASKPPVSAMPETYQTGLPAAPFSATVTLFGSSVGWPW